jgi:hypothetical protein
VNRLYQEENPVAVTVVLADDVAAIMEKIARAGIKHPVALSSSFTKVPLVFTFSLGANGSTPTVSIIEDDTHKWAYAAEPANTFDDRSLA